MLQLEAEEEEEEDDAHKERSEAEEIDPAQFALPTFLTAGTIFGSVIRVDLTKVRVDVETNDLSELSRFQSQLIMNGIRCTFMNAAVTCE